MLKGKCPKCGKVYYGYALRVSRNQFCDRCGVGLKISNGSGEVITGYSPFYARKYKVSGPDKTTASEKPQNTKEIKEPQEVKEPQGKEDGE